MNAIASRFRFLQGAVRRWRYARRFAEIDRTAVPAKLGLISSAPASPRRPIRPLAIGDQYLVGHGHRALLASNVLFESSRFALGASDVAMLSTAFAVAAGSSHMPGHVGLEHR